MTGARHLTSSRVACFQAALQFATDGINHFISASTARHLRLTFGKTRGLKYTVACEHKDIYADGLAEMFTGITQRRIRSRACRSWVTGTEANYNATLECRAPSVFMVQDIEDNQMRLVVISDTHGLHNRIEGLPDGDVLVHAAIL